jgi:DNA-binding transcriptional ArsR family regulator
MVLDMRTIGKGLDAGGPAAVLFGKTRRRLLAWLLTHPDESFYVRELVRFTGVAQGAVSGDLEKLAAAGILRRDTRGNQVFYQADAKSPISEELQSIFLKAAGLADETRRALKPVGSHGPPGDQKPVRRRRPRLRRALSVHGEPETEQRPAPDGAFLWES